MKPERPQEARDIEWAKILETALTAPGSVGNAYSRFYEYSFMNCMLLLMQGVEPQPVATYKRWQAMGRQVLKGSRAKEIVRPIIIEKKNDAGDVEKRMTRFKPVRCIFALSDTTGPELPPVEPRDWSLERATETLDIKRVPFKLYDGNTAGYSVGREYAINPVAVHPDKTAMHELSHIVSGHTTPERLAEYQQHRGVYEFEAEGSAHLLANELGIDTEEQASSSRAYLQGWLRGQAPPESSIRTVFKTTDTILRAGRLALAAEVEGAA